MPNRLHVNPNEWAGSQKELENRVKLINSNVTAKWKGYT